MTDSKIEAISRVLITAGSWRYLRYLHAREYVAKIAHEISTVCVCGTGHGWAEIALAIEFPHIHFTLTDIISDRGYPNYHKAMQFAWQNGLDNLSFSIWDVLEPTRRRFDLVCSTEMLEHIEQAPEAAANMRATATKYVYCLVPFADKKTNANPLRRQRALVHEHHVCGYDASELTELFPNPVALSGAYWSDAGQGFRKRLNDMTPIERSENSRELSGLARLDIKDAIPLVTSEAQGIKILSAV